MHASTGSRKRTRSEWAKHYKDWHDEVKAKKVSGPATVGGDKGARNVVDCESAIEDDSVASVDRFVTRVSKRIDLGEEVVSNDLGLGSIADNSKDSSPVLAISSDDSADPGNSRANIDGSDELDAKGDDLSDDAEDDDLPDDAEDDGSSDDEFSDVDYEADEQLTSDDSNDSYVDEQETEDEIDSALHENKEINTKQKVNDESDEGCDGDEKDEFPSVCKVTRISGKKGSHVDLKSAEGGCETYDSAGHNQSIADQEEEELVIISEDEFLGNCTNAATDKKHEDKQMRLGRFHEPCSDQGWVKASKVGDSTDFWRIVKESKVEDNSDMWRTVKERKVEDSTDMWRTVKESKVEDSSDMWRTVKESKVEDSSDMWRTVKESKDGDSPDSWRIVKESKEVNIDGNESSLKRRKALGVWKAEESNSIRGMNLGSAFSPCMASKLRKILGLENAEESYYNEGTNLSSLLRPCTAFKLPRNEHGPIKISSSYPRSGDFTPYKNHKSKSMGDGNSSQIELERQSCQDYLAKLMKLGKKNTHARKKSDLTKILVDSINTLKEEHYPIHENNPIQRTLQLRFRFEDEVQPPIEKSEWEKEMDSLFRDLELGHRESEIDFTSVSPTENHEHDSIEIDNSQATLCRRGEHERILDEEIGIICKYCGIVLLGIKHVLPDFHIPSSGRRNRMNIDESPNSVPRPILLRDPAMGNPGSGFGSYNCVQGTVWDLIPGVEKEMYPHQREGFEFLWRNLAGDIRLEKLKQPLSGGGRGCIISHAPGTGKTRLTIIFLQTFLKLYPTCRPVIIAPRGMLLTWEEEFLKWHVDVPFHNLNKLELSRVESAVATQLMGQVGRGEMNREHIRLTKLYSWMKGNSILGLSYQLFQKLSEESEEGQKQHIKNMLLELPGLLVLDEGHTPRNNQSQMWNALMEVVTQRRIILSGTPYQNTLAELQNTLCLVNPQFVNQIGSEYDTSSCNTRGRKRNMSGRRRAIITNSTGQKKVRLMNLKRMLDPFIHVYKGNILEEKLPGLSECLVFLHPTELQKTLMETAIKVDNILNRVQLVSFISVHPALMLKMEKFVSIPMNELEEVESDVDAGVKIKFVMQLIWLADALGERVLVFSQYIDPLIFIKKHIMSRFSWTEGREVLFMDGKLHEKQRQESILSFNDEKSSAKVLLASERACSEGISLIGASRVVLLDTVWNPAVEKQAVSRAYRLGQKKVVYVYRLFTSGTEVWQFAQQITKQRISEVVVSPTDGDTFQNKKKSAVPDDKIMEAMRFMDASGDTFEKIIHQPKESDLIEIYGLMDEQQ